jgi:hypothetical protein
VPRQSQLIEIDLRSGVVTNASPYDVGAKLWRATNTAWNYPYPRQVAVTGGDFYMGPWIHRPPLTFPALQGVNFTGIKMARDLVFGAPVTGIIGVAGTNASDQYALWSIQGGAEITFDGTAPRATVPATEYTHGCSVRWLHPGNHPRTGAPTTSSITVFGHRDVAHIYYMMGTDSTVFALDVDVTNCPTNASGLAVHLDRLWIGSNDNKLYYTDPLNVDSIRTTNVINLDQAPECLVPGQFGTIDASGVAHLVIGCRTSVLVLDGDPQLGGGLQADLRVLHPQIGMLTPNAAATTPYGVFYLGTDGNLWQVPLGMAETRPVGDLFRNVIATRPPDLLDADAYAMGTLTWFDPYLYLFPCGDVWGNGWICRPSKDGIAEVWGPLTMDADGAAILGIVKAAAPISAGFAPSGKNVPSVHVVSQVPTPAATPNMKVSAFDWRTAPTGSYPNGGQVGRTASVETGRITVPGHRIQATRVLLETIGALAGPWTVVVSKEEGDRVTATRVQHSATSAGTYDPTIITTHVFAVAPLTASRGLTVTITGAAGEDLGLVRAFVEVHTTPALY